MNTILFFALDGIVCGTRPGFQLLMELMVEGLIRHTGKSYAPTLTGMALWRSYRVIPGYITPAQAVLHEALWGTVTPQALEAKLDPSLFTTVGDRRLLEEATITRMFGPEAVEAYSRYA